jgi:ABC-type phosphate transport system auxiliary subunit
MELPDELKELKLRLKFELDSNCIDRVIDEWYEEYQEDYNTLVESVDTIQEQAEKDAEYWRNWALQNIS